MEENELTPPLSLLPSPYLLLLVDLQNKNIKTKEKVLPAPRFQRSSEQRR